MTDFGYATISGVRFTGNPVNANITDRFGTWSEWRKSQGMGWHTGLDLAAPEGTPLLAPAPGIFVYSGWTEGGLGYITTLDHGDIGTLYAHQPRTYTGMRPGQRFERGERIGTVGNTGMSSGPHVHWMVTRKRSGSLWDFTRDGGGLFDPLSLITTAKEPPKGKPVTLTAEQQQMVDWLRTPEGQRLDANTVRYYLGTVGLDEMPPEVAPAATYTVQRGDTLGVIAQRHGVTTTDLARWNGITDPNRIEVGQVLRLTAPTATPAPQPAPETPKTPPPGTPAARKAEVAASIASLERAALDLHRGIVELKQQHAAS